MPRSPAAFKQSDISKAVKPLLKLGIPIQAVEISPSGEISIVFAKASSNHEPNSERNEWDDVK